MKDEFERNGFLQINELLPEQVVVEAESGIQCVMDGQYRLGRPPLNISPRGSERAEMIRIDQPHWADPGLQSLVCNPLLANTAAQLLNTSVIQVWYAHALYKPPVSEASHVGWHADGQYVDFFENDFVTAWVALSDIRGDSGTLTYIKGSHNVSLPRVSGFSSKTSYENQVERIRSIYPSAMQEVHIIGNRGTVSFHHSRMLHGSGANRSEHPRMTVTIHYRGARNRLRRPLPSNFVTSTLAIPRDSPIVLGTAQMLDMP